MSDLISKPPHQIPVGSRGKVQRLYLRFGGSVAGPSHSQQLDSSVERKREKKTPLHIKIYLFLFISKNGFTIETLIGVSSLAQRKEFMLPTPTVLFTSTSGNQTCIICFFSFLKASLLPLQMIFCTENLPLLTMYSLLKHVNKLPTFSEVQSSVK